MKKILFGLALVSMLVVASAAFAQPSATQSATATLQIDQYCLATLVIDPSTTNPQEITSGVGSFGFQFDAAIQANFPVNVYLTSATPVGDLSLLSIPGTVVSPNPFLAVYPSGVNYTAGVFTVTGSVDNHVGYGTYGVTYTLTVSG